jgi:CxxC motif-containing protein (DUF1111 family)
MNKLKWTRLVVILAALVGTLYGCSKLLPKAPDAGLTIAEPIEGLTDAQLAMFLQGDVLFAKVYTPEEGLGPVFVQHACEGCHVGDGKGHPFNMITRFGNDSGSSFDYMEDKSGPQLQHRSIAGYLAESLPPGYTHSTERLAPIVIGMGLLAALHDSTILNMADPSDLNGDGISGRVNYIQPENFFTSEDIHIDSAGWYIGRFGKKARKVTLLEQVVFALKEDIGLTSDFDTEDLSNYLVGDNTGDQVPDPEVSSAVVDRLVFYMRTLKAPTRRDENNVNVLAGEEVFNDIGCVGCHKPNLTTSVSEIDALSQKDFHPYTDLLLHYMGPGLDDGYPEGSAVGGEWRTPPLWGLGLAEDSQGGTGYYLHDGRATTLKQAITMHDGEASLVLNNYLLLNETQKNDLITFLKSL